MDDVISRQAVIEINQSYHGQMPNEVNHRIWKEINELPSAQQDSKETSPTHKALDTISRQAALNALSRGSGCGASCHRAIKALPSAQSELPEWAQKVEEYRKSAPSFVRNQLVWALYQTWKEYDGRLVHQRGKENR